MIFGVFADIHYSMKNNDEARFFRSALKKTGKCMEFFKKSNVDFIICMGDLVDCGGDEAQQHLLLENIRDVVCADKIPFYLCLGNHDVTAYSYRGIMRKFMPDCQKEYYSFDRGNLHFAVLDTNYDKLDVHYTKETMRWDELYVDEKQLQWLRDDLKQTSHPAVICTHGNLDERKIGGALDPHIVKNYREVQCVIRESGKVCLVLQGHCHSGNVGWQDGILYMTIPALVDGEKEIPLALVKDEGSTKLEILLFDVGENVIEPRERILIDKMRN